MKNKLDANGGIAAGTSMGSARFNKDDLPMLAVKRNRSKLAELQRIKKRLAEIAKRKGETT